MEDQQTALVRLSDEANIRTLIARFAEAANLDDHDAFRACWAEDGDWSLPHPYPAKAKGHREIVDLLRTLREGKEFFVQFAVPGVIRIEGDTATVLCVMHEAARGVGGIYYRNHGFFNDRLQRAGDGWVFTRRDYHYLWLDTSPFAGEVFPLDLNTLF